MHATATTTTTTLPTYTTMPTYTPAQTYTAKTYMPVQTTPAVTKDPLGSKKEPYSHCFSTLKLKIHVYTSCKIVYLAKRILALV
jgi:hypothetical protein